MLLIIPAVEIRGGRCVQMVQGLEGFSYSTDPVEMARLWRKENAKSLHVTDVDGARAGKLVNTGVIRTMIETVDIPVELGGGLRTFEDVRLASDLTFELLDAILEFAHARVPGTRPPRFSPPSGRRRACTARRARAR